jgi:hypothetical protein
MPSPILPDPVLYPLLPIVPYEYYLQRLESLDFNVFDSRLLLRDIRLFWRLWRTTQKRHFN